jgi:hypothetical protein
MVTTVLSGEMGIRETERFMGKDKSAQRLLLDTGDRLHLAQPPPTRREHEA